MSDAKHTPGPWRITYEHGSMRIRSADNISLMCNETYYPWVPDNIADWNIIAAAPDMLEALCVAARHENIAAFAEGRQVDHWYEAVVLAILKATGSKP